MELRLTRTHRYVKWWTLLDKVIRIMHMVHTFLSFGINQFYPHPLSGLFHWHWGNHVIAPVPGEQSWKIWVNCSQESTRNMIIKTNQNLYFTGCIVWPDHIMVIIVRYSNDDIIMMAQKHFLHCWPFVRGIHLNELLNKQSSSHWFQMPWRSCEVNVMHSRGPQLGLTFAIAVHRWLIWYSKPVQNLPGSSNCTKCCLSIMFFWFVSSFWYF